jgi:phage repressor protein C with HTH and peptisase S24 domain
MAAGFERASDAARAIGVAEPTYLGHENGSRGFRADDAQKYASRFGVNFEWLMTGKGEMRPRGAQAPQTEAVRAPFDPPPISLMPLDVPVMGTAVGGSDGAFELNGQVVDYVRRPPGIAKNPNVFCIYVHGDSMSPRFEQGELIYCNPTRPARPGDYVVVELKPSRPGESGHAYIKRLLAKTPTKLKLSQLNPAKADLEFPAEAVLRVSIILGLADLLGV